MTELAKAIVAFLITWFIVIVVVVGLSRYAEFRGTDQAWWQPNNHKGCAS